MNNVKVKWRVHNRTDYTENRSLAEISKHPYIYLHNVTVKIKSKTIFLNRYLQLYTAQV